MVEFGETPVDKTQLAIGMVDHNIVGLNIAMHDSLRVAEVKSLQDLKHVKSDIKISKTLVQGAEINIASVNVLHDQGGGLGHWVSDHVDQVDDVDAVSQSLKNLDFPSDFGFFNYQVNSQSTYRALGF